MSSDLLERRVEDAGSLVLSWVSPGSKKAADLLGILFGNNDSRVGHAATAIYVDILLEVQQKVEVLRSRVHGVEEELKRTNSSVARQILRAGVERMAEATSSSSRDAFGWATANQFDPEVEEVLRRYWARVAGELTDDDAHWLAILATHDLLMPANDSPLGPAGDLHKAQKGQLDASIQFVMGRNQQRDPDKDYLSGIPEYCELVRSMDVAAGQAIWDMMNSLQRRGFVSARSLVLVRDEKRVPLQLLSTSATGTPLARMLAGPIGES